MRDQPAAGPEGSEEVPHLSAAPARLRQDQTMPFLSYEARNFATALAGPASGVLSLSLARLVWGAVTVGMTPFAMGGSPRPLLELGWRAALTAASLTEDPASGRWAMTAGYRRLDPSEKRAVSYFLGMTQAKITCEHLLRTPHLMHLDAYLAMIGRPSRASRPDLIGLSLPSLDCTIAVEAKGRTGGRTGRVTAAAKKQAQSLPTVVSASSAVRVASVASFDPRGCWEAYLEDPPDSLTAMASLTAGSLLAAYYRPLVAAQAEAGDRQITDENSITSAQLPGIDLVLGIPTVIVTIIRTLPLTGPVPADQLWAVEADLLEVVRSRHLTSRADAAGLYIERTQGQPAPSRSYTGLDGIYVGLGSSWA
jgi:hypothetical protein